MSPLTFLKYNVKSSNDKIKMSLFKKKLERVCNFALPYHVVLDDVTRTVSVNIKFALVYGQDDRIWLQVAAFFSCIFWGGEKDYCKKGFET